MFKQHPIWYGVGLTIIPLFILALGYLNIHPEFYRSIPKNFADSKNATYSGIAWADDEKEDPPLEYVSDSFKGIRITTNAAVVTSFWGLWNRPNSQIEYEWRYKVKNLTDTTLKILVTYELNGDQGAIIANSEASKVAEPGETIEIKQVGRLDYTEALDVSGSGWLISRREVP